MFSKYSHFLYLQLLDRDIFFQTMAVSEMPANMFAIDVVMPFHLVVDWPPNTPEFFSFIDLVKMIMEPEFEIEISTWRAMFKIRVPAIPLELYDLLNEALKDEEITWLLLWDESGRIEE